MHPYTSLTAPSAGSGFDLPNDDLLFRVRRVIRVALITGDDPAAAVLQELATQTASQAGRPDYRPRHGAD